MSGRIDAIGGLMNSTAGRVARKFIEDQAPNWAALIAWNTLFAMFPIVIFAASLLGFALQLFGQANTAVYTTIFSVSPTDTRQQDELIKAVSGVARTFTTERPIVFAYHGYPWLIHRLTYRRANHRNLHVRGYKEEGTTTTPFDMVMLNDLDRFHLVLDVIDRVPGLIERAAHLRQDMEDARLRARAWTREHGEDMPQIRDWTWPY